MLDKHIRKICEECLIDATGTNGHIDEDFHLNNPTIYAFTKMSDTEHIKVLNNLSERFKRSFGYAICSAVNDVITESIKRPGDVVH